MAWHLSPTLVKRLYSLVLAVVPRQQDGIMFGTMRTQLALLDLLRLPNAVSEPLVHNLVDIPTPDAVARKHPIVGFIQSPDALQASASRIRREDALEVSIHPKHLPAELELLFQGYCFRAIAIDVVLGFEVYIWELSQDAIVKPMWYK